MMPKAAQWRNRIIGHGEETPDQLLANPANWRIHPKAQQDALSGVLDEVGWVQDIIVNQQTGHVVDGHLRVSLAISRREPTVPVVYVDLTPAEEALVLATIDPLSAMAVADKEQLDALLREVATEDAAVMAMLAELAERVGIAPGDDGLSKEQARQTLAERFIVPPFSVLDARQGYWQERKRAWLALGIESELGRGDNALDGGHSDQSINIDFYAQKRALEAEMGETLTTDAARNVLVARGIIRHVDRSKAGKAVTPGGGGDPTSTARLSRSAGGYRTAPKSVNGRERERE